MTKTKARASAQFAVREALAQAGRSRGTRKWYTPASQCSGRSREARVEGCHAAGHS